VIPPAGLERAATLAGVLEGPAPDSASGLEARPDWGPGALREAAAVIEEAAADPDGFAAAHGIGTLERVRVGAEGLRLLRRMMRRDHALEALYAAEQTGSPPDPGSYGDAAVQLVDGVWASREDLDRAIGEVAVGWRVERMAPVDRTLLRLALWELRHQPATPVAVIVSEAVRLAKVYSTESSGRFVNGVLSGLAEGVRPGG
jgi:N utilization substance protein B